MEATPDHTARNPRQEIALACRALYDAHCMTGIGGHVSVRADDGTTYWVNCLDKEFSEITEDFVVRMSPAGEVIEGGSGPSPGVYFHPQIYASRPDVHAIIHTHAPWLSKLAALRRPPRMLNVDSVFFHEDCAVTDDPLDRIAEGLGESNNAIIPHHGAVSVAGGLGRAVALHIVFEYAAYLDLWLGDRAESMALEDVVRTQELMERTQKLELTWELLRRKALAGVPGRPLAAVG